MKDHKLIPLLKELKKREIRLFQSFLNSSVIKVDVPMITLMSLLQEAHPNFSQKKIEKKALFLKIWPSDSYNSTRLSNTTGKLYHALKLFLAFSSLSTNKELLFETLSKVNIVQKHLAVFSENSDKWKRYILNQKDSIEKYHSLKNYYEFNLEYGSRDAFTDKNRQHLYDKTKEYFQLYYLATKLYHTCEDILQERMFQKQQASATYSSDLLKKAERYAVPEQPVISVYYAILSYLLGRETNLVSFVMLVDIYVRYSDTISDKENREVLLFLTKICINERKINGHDVFVLFNHELYKWGIEKGVFIEKDFIKPNSFLNIIIIAFAAKDVPFAKTFFFKYRAFIEKEDRMEAGYLFLALLRIENGQYNKALLLLAKITLKYARYRLRVQYLSLMVQYCIFLGNPYGHFEKLESKLNSTYAFFTREAIIALEAKEASLNFISIIRKLKNAYLNQGKYSKQDIKELVVNMDKIVYRSWLLQQINLLP